MKRALPVLLLLAACGRGGVSDPANVPVSTPPPTISPEILVQPSDASCAPALCSGGDALVTATVTPASSRTLRFGVTGPINIVGDNEVATDAQGKASVHIRALPSAPTQPATVQVTDLGSGVFQRVSLVVVQTTASSVLVIPPVLTFMGPNTNQCGNGSSDVYLFGGTPPYVVGQSFDFAISPQIVQASGGSFNVKALGSCVTGTIPITDAAGRVSTVTLQNLPGTTPVPNVTPTPLAAAPSSVTLGNCSTVADVSVVGGTGTYGTNSSDSTAVYAHQTGINTVTIGRNPKSTAVEKSAVTIQSGNEIVTVAVEVPTATVTCP